MINEIYVNKILIKNEEPSSQFKGGYEIKCTHCDNIISLKGFNNKHLVEKYKCKSCVFNYFNPMKDPKVKERHNLIMQSDEYRQKMSELTKGKNNGFYGKTFKNESIDKIKEGNKKYWESLSDEEKVAKSNQMKEIQSNLIKDDPITYKRNRSKAAKKSHISQFRNTEMNQIEKSVYNYLIELGEEPEFSKIFASYQYDIGIKKFKLLIEINGDYWHGNPDYYNNEGNNGKRKLSNIQLCKQKRDIEKKEWAINRGFKYFVLWEADVRNGNFKNILKFKIDEIKKNQ
jgi:G:T-mismatch repair DNA endonuclease (very short patch repair protein)